MPQQALVWSSRQQLLLDEILRPQADIVCLQEVNKYGQTQTCTHCKKSVAVQSFSLRTKLLSRLLLQRISSYLCWKSMDTVALISASPVRQLSNMAHLAMVVRCSTAPIVLLFAQSLKVRPLQLAAKLLCYRCSLFNLVWRCLNHPQTGSL